MKMSQDCFSLSKIESVKSDLLLVPFKSKDVLKSFLETYPALFGNVEDLLAYLLIDKESINTALFPVKDKGSFGFSRVLFYKINNSPDSTPIKTEAEHANLFGDLIRLVKKYESAAIFIDLLELDHLETTGIEALVQGSVMATFQLTRFISDDAKKKWNLSSLAFVSQKFCDQSFFDSGYYLGEAVNFARCLASTPSNYLTPQHFVDLVKEELENFPKIKLKIIDKKEAKEMGMTAFLSVAQGSEQAPYCLVIEYHGEESFSNPIALVGKGVTFDSGGISIKPSRSMSEMKGDMSGAAAVFASIRALNRLKVKKSVLAIMPLTENMPSGSALKPGDVIYAMNGKSIEIINTDAEGRLILADALCYASSRSARCIVDIATLTGACTVALGEWAIGLLGNDEQLINTMLAVGERTGQRLWNLPLFKDYMDYLESDVADMLNCHEGREAGTIVAAKFLEQFVDKKPWIHLDIASTMTNKKSTGYNTKGMSGSGVLNLVRFVQAI